jgi:hypothetical protein
MVLASKPIEALASDKPPEKWFIIRASHEVEVTYRVKGIDFDDALSKLCDKELWTQYGFSYNASFGPDETVLEEIGAEVVDTDSYGDPSPTGRSWTQRDWDWDEEEEDEE